VPTIVTDAWEQAADRYITFLTATIRNAHTGKAYARAVLGLFAWRHRHRLTLQAIKPKHVAAYVELLQQRSEKPLAAPSVERHRAAIRMYFDWLTSGGNLDVNPATSVLGPKQAIKKGETVVLTADQAGALLDIAPTKIGREPEEGQEDNRPPSLIGLRDRALIAVVCYCFARVTAPSHSSPTQPPESGVQCLRNRPQLLSPRTR